MNISTILIIVFSCVIYRLAFKDRGLDWFILAGTLISIFWFQPISTIRTLDFWLPFSGIALGIICWCVVTKKENIQDKDNILTYAIIVLILGILASTRYFQIIELSQFISAPRIIYVLIAILILSFLITLIKNAKNRKHFLVVLIAIVLLIFILLKNETLSLQISRILRDINKQSLKLASSSEISWIGFSYFAFRLLHTLIDKNNGIDHNVSLRTYISYLFYFPALLAGPIVRIDQFENEVKSEKKQISEDLYQGMYRIIIGLMQKFIIADTLAHISLNPSLSQEITSIGWMWFVVILYSLRIYFDFNGYTHIAIGISHLLGITLPENFNKPLLSPTLNLFWNNWHITLTQWFRSYYFNPLTRFLRRKYRNMDARIIMGFMQISTMVLIGLWHGISDNFLAWGVWIGLGLFIQTQLSGYITKRFGEGSPIWKKSNIHRVVSTSLTFLYISLGWVWFALPDLETSVRVFKVLFGIQ